jgi:hypothetical protein
MSRFPVSSADVSGRGKPLAAPLRTDGRRRRIDVRFAQGYAI